MATALVTGASSGIGAEFARQLCRRGHDLLLVARRRELLDALAAELSGFGVRAEVLVADLIDAGDVRLVADRLRDPANPIDLLVNNAGRGSFGRFASLDVEGELDEIRLNVLALVELTHAALEAMLPRGSGGVINVASLAAYQPAPNNATYSATKAYVKSFTEAIHEEVKGSGVRVMVSCPGFTRTQFGVNAGGDPSLVPALLWDDVGIVVATALADYEKGRAVSIPTAKNKVLGGLSAVTPHAVTRRLVSAVLRRST